MPYSLNFIAGHREVPVGEHLCLKYEMFDAQNRKMLKFDMIQVNKRVADPSIFMSATESVLSFSNCTSLWYQDVFGVQAQTFGFTSAKLAYKNKIHAKTPIAAFNPLRFVEPADEGTATLALGSSLAFVTGT